MTCKEKLAADRPYLTEVELGYEELLKIIEEKEKEIRILKSKLNYLYGRKVLDDFVNGFAKRKD